jgi:hypothetical protein
MIAGTIVLEDVTLHFTSTDRGGFNVEISSGATSGSVQATGSGFAAALMLALDPNGGDNLPGDMQNYLYGLAELAQWKSEATPEGRRREASLRFIP